nr:hypothetical protein [Mycobacteroides abscessus]
MPRTGAFVSVTDRRLEDATAVVDAVGERAVPWALDVTDDAQISEVVTAVGARCGRSTIPATATPGTGRNHGQLHLPGTHRYRDDGRDPRRGQGCLRSPAHRVTPLGRAEELAHMTLSVCLPAASYLTGAVIPVDGGLMARNA